MGYYATWEAKIVVKAAQKDACLAAINAMMTPEGMEANGARGGRYSGGKKVKRFYSWMNGNTAPWSDLETAFDEWTLTDETMEAGEDEDGNFFHRGFHDSKVGNEEAFLKVIAPFCEDTLIECVGEDDSRWAYIIKGGKLFEAAAKQTVYDVPEGMFDDPEILSIVGQN